MTGYVCNENQLLQAKNLDEHLTMIRERSKDNQGDCAMSSKNMTNFGSE